MSLRKLVRSRIILIPAVIAAVTGLLWIALRPSGSSPSRPGGSQPDSASYEAAYELCAASIRSALESPPQNEIALSVARGQLEQLLKRHSTRAFSDTSAKEQTRAFLQLVTARLGSPALKLRDGMEFEDARVVRSRIEKCSIARHRVIRAISLYARRHPEFDPFPYLPDMGSEAHFNEDIRNLGR